MKHTSLSLKTITELRECYNTHSQKFSSTRKKNRPELAYILQEIDLMYQQLQRPLSIVELGCGDGRLYRALQEHYSDRIQTYVGVDISEELLAIAQSHPYEKSTTQRIHNDMIWYLSQEKKDSIDVIISLASYQHLPDKTTRAQYGEQVYRTLQYEGQWICVDRSWSLRMIKKHYRALGRSLKKTLLTLGDREWNNLMIPFTHEGKTHYRLYHISTIIEIRNMLKKHNLQLSQRTYSSQKGVFHHNVLGARNICYVAKKTIYKKEF